MFGRKRTEPVPAVLLPAPNQQHAELVAGLIERTDADEVIWRRRVDSVDVYGTDRHAELDGLKFVLGSGDLAIYCDWSSERVPRCQETTGLGAAIGRQEKRLNARLLETAAVALGRSSSGEHGSGPTTPV